MQHKINLFCSALYNLYKGGLPNNSKRLMEISEYNRNTKKNFKHP